MLGNGNQREPLGFVVSPPSFGGLKIGARARARTRSVSSSGTRESSGLFKHAPGVLPDPALGSGDRSKISPAGTQ
jgi:hypothetical protein